MALPESVIDQLVNELAQDPEFQRADAAHQIEMFKQRARVLEESSSRLRLDPTRTPNPKRESIQQGYPQPQTFAEGVTRFATEDVPEIGAATVGGMKGAELASKIPAPPALRPLVTGVGGVLGATSGLMSAREGRKVLTRGALPSADEAIADTQRALGETVVGEGLGVGLRLLGKGYQRGKQYVLAGRPATSSELQTFESAKDMGVHLRPADVTASPAALRTEQTLRTTQAGSDIFRGRDILNQETFSKAYERDLLDTVATKTTPQERGQLIQHVIEGRAIPEYQEMARRGFDELRTITQGEKLVVPKESFALAQELAASVTADTNPKARGIVARVLEQIGQPGTATGMKVTRREITVPGESRLTGLNVRETSSIKQAPLTTGLSVKGKYGQVSEVDQAIEDLGGKAAEPPLLGLQVKTRSDAPQPSVTTGLKVSPRYETGPGTQKLTGLSAEVTSRAPSVPRPLDFMEAHDIRSMLGELGATGETLPKKAQGIANRLWQTLGLEMEQGAITFQQKTGIPLARKWRQADDLVKDQGHALFDANVISKMVKANPEDVVRETLKKDGLTEVQTVVKALERIKDEPGLEQYRRGVLEQLWKEGTVERGMKRGEFSGTQFADAAQKYGEDVLKTALGPVYTRYQKFLDVARHMDPKAASGLGMSLIDKGVLLTAPLAGIGGSVMAGSPYPIVAAAGGMATWLITTHHFSKILNDPKKAGQLLRVAKTSPGTQGWTRAVGELLSVETGERAVAPSLPPLMPTTLQPAPVMP